MFQKLTLHWCITHQPRILYKTVKTIFLLLLPLVHINYTWFPQVKQFQTPTGDSLSLASCYSCQSWFKIIKTYYYYQNLSNLVKKGQNAMPEVKNKPGEIFWLQDRHVGIFLPYFSFTRFNSKSINRWA